METWLPVVGYAGYEVSSTGLVRSLAREVVRGDGTVQRITGQMLTQGRLGKYPAVSMSRNRRSERKVVHRIVADAFLGPAPTPQHMVCHKNDVGHDNRVENLYWGTSSENQMDALRNGKHTGANKLRCKNGHERVEENVRRVAVAPGRVHVRCLLCERDWANDYLARRREAGVQDPPPDPASTCYRGHPQTADNMHRTTDGGWACRLCVREWSQERIARAVAAGAEPRVPEPGSSCKHGHVLDSENTAYTLAGAPLCRICTRAAVNRSAAKRRAAEKAARTVDSE